MKIWIWSSVCFSVDRLQHRRHVIACCARVGSKVSAYDRIRSSSKVSLQVFSRFFFVYFSQRFSNSKHSKLPPPQPTPPPLRKRSQLRSHTDDHLQSENFPICCTSLEATQTDCPGISGATSTLREATGESSPAVRESSDPPALRRSSQTRGHWQLLGTFRCCCQTSRPISACHDEKGRRCCCCCNCPFLSITAFPQ